MSEPDGQAMSEPARRLPVILVVDDEPTVLAAVARDLRRVRGELPDRPRRLGEEALEVLRDVVRRGEQVALLVADQRMPGLSGTDYLVRGAVLVTTAKRVYSPRARRHRAAIEAINEVDLTVPAGAGGTHRAADSRRKWRRRRPAPRSKRAGCA